MFAAAAAAAAVVAAILGLSILGLRVLGVDTAVVVAAILGLRIRLHITIHWGQHWHLIVGLWRHIVVGSFIYLIAGLWRHIVVGIFIYLIVVGSFIYPWHLILRTHMIALASSSSYRLLVTELWRLI